MSQQRHIWALFLTSECNLACSYCYCRNTKPRGDMSWPTAMKAVEFLLRHSRESGAKSIDIGFFGREPTLRFDTVKAVINAARGERDVTFSLNTNGLLLDQEKLGFLTSAVVKIAVSLDGVWEDHDRNRRDRLGMTSSGILERLLPDLVQYSPAVYARMTITPANAARFAENARAIFDLGFRKLGFAFDLTDDGWDLEILEALDRSLKEFAAWYAETVINGRDLTVPAFDSLARGRSVPETGLFCGAASTLFCIDCDGAIYPCWRFAGDGEHVMGSVHTGFAAPPEAHVFNSMSQRHIGSCARCPHTGYCGRCAWVSVRQAAAHDRLTAAQCATAMSAVEAGLKACDMLVKAKSAIFLSRLESMDVFKGVDPGDILLAGSSGLFLAPEAEIEKFRVR
jgi:uncharacterized protein